jgi:hypothetical protein
MATTTWPPFLPETTCLERSAQERREAGHRHFSEVMEALLRRISHPQLSELASWACNDAGTLHTSQISQMRNNKARILGTKAIDALGRVNQAAWVARHQPQWLQALGCGPITPRIQLLLGAYEPLVDPLSLEPLGSGAFLEIFLGLRRLPIEVPRTLRPAEAKRLAERLGDWLDEQIRARELSFREACRRLQEAWSGEQAGAKRLVRVLAGLENYSAKQLAEDWERIAVAIQTLLGLEPDVWALADELSAAPIRQQEPLAGAGGKVATKAQVARPSATPSKPPSQPVRRRRDQMTAARRNRARS